MWQNVSTEVCTQISEEGECFFRVRFFCNIKLACWGQLPCPRPILRSKQSIFVFFSSILKIPSIFWSLPQKESTVNWSSVLCDCKTLARSARSQQLPDELTICSCFCFFIFLKHASYYLRHLINDTSADHQTFQDFIRLQFSYASLVHHENVSAKSDVKSLNTFASAKNICKLNF